MNWLDIIILIVLLGSAVIGFRGGLIRGILGLAGMIVGVILAGRFYHAFAERLSFISSKDVANVVAFAIVFVAVVAVSAVVAFFLKKAVSIVTLGWADRLGGVVFGLFVGSLFLGAILAAWVKFLGMSAAIGDSAFARVLLDKFPVVLGLLPRDFDSIRSFFS